MGSINRKISRYPGLRAFEGREERLFFAREKEILSLLDYIKIKPIVVLFSKSGMGKSSLINAKLVSELGRQRNEDGDPFLPIKIRLQSPKKEGIKLLPPIDMVKAGLEHYLRADFLKEMTGKEPGESTLWEYVNACDFSSTAPVFIFDQFEELFSNDIALRKKFSIELAELVRKQTPNYVKDEFRKIEKRDRTAAQIAWYKPIEVKVLIAIRSSRLSELDKMSEIPSILKNRFRLRSLSRKQAKDAIVKPSRIEGEEAFLKSDKFSYDTAAQEQILDKLSNSGRGKIEPLYLQLLCRRIEKLVIEKGIEVVTPELYGGSKGIDSLLDEYYNMMLKEIEEEDRKFVRVLIEEKMILNGKRVLVAEDLILHGYHIRETVLDKLVDDLRLIRKEDLGENRIAYEIGHDALVKPIKKAYRKRKEIEVAYEIEEAKKNEQIAIEEKRKAEESERLALGEKRAAEKKESIALEKKQQAEKSIRRIRNILFLIFGLLVIGIMASLWREIELHKENTDRETKEKKQAQKDLHMSFATSNFSDPTKSFRYAQKAYEEDTTDQRVVQTILSTYNRPNYIQFYQIVKGDEKKDGNITDISFSSNNKILLSTSSKGKVAIWKVGDYSISKAPTILANHNIKFAKLFIHKKEDLIATYDSGNVLQVWDLEGTEKLNLDICSIYKNAIRNSVVWQYSIKSLSISPDGGKLLFGIDGKGPNGLILISYPAGEILSAKSVKKKGLSQVEFIDNHYFYVRANVAIWPYKFTWEEGLISPPDSYLPKGSTVSKVLVAENGNRVFSADEKGKFYFYKCIEKPEGLRFTYSEYKEGNVLFVSDDKKPILSAAMSNDREIIVVGSENNNVLLWNRINKKFNQYRKVKTMEGHKSDVNYIDISPEGKIIATASEDKTIRLWDNKGNEIQAISGLENKKTSIAFSQGQDKFLAVSDGPDIKVWYFKDERLSVLKFDNKVNAIRSSCAKSVEGFCVNKLLVSEGKEAHVINLSDLKIEKTVNFNEEIKGAKLFNYTKQGSGEIFIYGNTTIQLQGWDGVDDFVIYPKLTSSPYCDSSRASVVGADYSLETVGIISLHNDYSTRLWTSKDSFENLIYFYNYGCGREKNYNDFDFERYKYQKIGYLPDLGTGKQYYVIRPDNVVFFLNSFDSISTKEMWDNAVTTKLEGHSSTINSISFYVDTLGNSLKYVLTTSSDNSAIIWNHKGELLDKLDDGGSGHYDDVLCADFSSDGNFVITGSADRTVKIWEKVKETEWRNILTLEEHQGEVQFVGFSYDRKRIFSYSDDGELRVKPIELDVQEIFDKVDKEKVYGDVWKLEPDK